MTKMLAETIKCFYAVSNGSLGLLQKALWPRRRPEQARRVCVYRVGNVGDIVCALPALFAIRRAYPQAHLTLLTSPGKRGAPGAQELLERAPWLDRLWVYHSEDVGTYRQRWALLARLREAAFDVWFELPNDLATVPLSLRNMAMARRTAARWAYGWRISTLRWATRAQSEHEIFPNEVDRLIRVVREAGIPVEGVRFPLPLTEHHRLAVDRLLMTTAFERKPLAAISPGARKALNQWPADRFAQVARHLSEKGFCVVSLGRATDAPLCQSVVDSLGASGANLAGKTSLLEACELLKRCRLIVTNDSGLQHLAAAVGTPCVSIFSFWQLRGKWRPYGTQHQILQKWVPCNSCYVDLCPFENRCIRLVETSEVLEAADSICNGHREGVR